MCGCKIPAGETFPTHDPFLRYSQGFQEVLAEQQADTVLEFARPGRLSWPHRPSAGCTARRSGICGTEESLRTGHPHIPVSR